MALSPGAKYIATRPRRKRAFAREKLYLLTINKGDEPLPIVATGFKADLSGNLMLYHHGRLMVLKHWESLKEADFDNPADPDLDPEDVEAGTEPA